MSIQGAVNTALGVTAAATRFSRYNLKAKMAQAKADVEEKQEAIKQQLKEREENKKKVREQYGWVGTLGADAQKSVIKQVPELQEMIKKDIRLEEQLNGK